MLPLSGAIYNLTHLVEQHACSGGQSVARPHGLEVQKEGLAELVEGTGSAVEELVVYDPRGEVVAPFPLTQSEVDSVPCSGEGGAQHASPRLSTSTDTPVQTIMLQQRYYFKREIIREYLHLDPRLRCRCGQMPGSGAVG